MGSILPVISGDKHPGNVPFASLSIKIGCVWMQKASQPLLAGLSAVTQWIGGTGLCSPLSALDV